MNSNSMGPYWKRNGYSDDLYAPGPAGPGGDRTIIFLHGNGQGRRMMGYRGAWIAFADIEKAEVLSRLSLRDTGAPDDTGMEPFAGGMTAAGWYVVLAYERELDMDFSLAKLSAGCRLIGVEVFEGVMTSQAQAFEDGNKLWNLFI